ncbi:MAG: hypothetical protein COZ37_04715 [bacterium (Candidatus Ratteibacteria) CG_4_10_14_3_um_filter_41_18]|uniref:SpoVT-AbrB domain-containing protein n=4 Tax=Candidatus Ratteibacteria TaxID=2979319 RepID=A0A2M7YEZ3_9BACT|nr:MAG: hypothetical protein AUJ76_00705 [Candidatus Omnitrophica bacterium CG1_02_41_171]PIV63875.1 MAG: hypothetical protein COS11_05115 [bacterium (Candidatus Ratteibacteria) CG01_land_8_20_14_3_00_40_19]PIW32673.1 MAG: hypothetical protein COW28_05465 [bacterium (Candidatus Ratteibacteria) CG15_BIG_FIL_POST_REV_8_21_14_020_41_12]PIW74232.1 MAG: hypothetical protein CO004_01765 [bacterium (Candidatus Ratteibacteria) CG_4_8_14_3_um_filter_41_36]PIX77053.1 MAG: hypothetical protein COZ37_04715
MSAHRENEQLVKEKFKSVGVGFLDSKKRITLKNKVMKESPLNHMKIDALEILLGNEGDILLRPMTNIPSKELWIYQNPRVLKRIQKGLQDAREGKIKEVKNLKKFLKNL